MTSMWSVSEPIIFPGSTIDAELVSISSAMLIVNVLVKDDKSFRFSDSGILSQIETYFSSAENI
jgi:hypothetical protein